MQKSLLFFLFILFAPITLEAKTPDNYENQLTSWSKHQNLKQNSAFKNLHWRNIGPVVQGGRAVAVRASLQNDHLLYVGYASGGIWKSQNKGITFSSITDKLPSQIVGAFDIDPNNDKILWLGTGENNSSRSSYGGMGIYRTEDGGKNWQYMGLGNTNRIGDILVDPTNSNRVYVAALGPLYTKGGDRGVFVTEDAGKTWTKVLDGNEDTGFVDLSIAKNGDIYASAWQRMRKSWDFTESGVNSKIYKSENKGKTWKVLSKGLPSGKYVGRMGVDVSQSDANVVYVVVDNQEPLPENQWDFGDTAINAKRLKSMSVDEFLLQDEKNIEKFLRNNNFPPKTTTQSVIQALKDKTMEINDLLKPLEDANSNLFNSDIKGLEVYRSEDAGLSFVKTHDAPLSNVVFTYGYYFGKIHVDPNDANTIYTMGVPLIKSTDGGKNWSSLYDPTVHVDYHELWIDPQNSSHIIAANDGGIDESYDAGEHWRKLDAQPVGQFYTVAVDMENPYNVYGGLQDNGTLKGSSTTQWTKGESWERLFGGDGMHVSIDGEVVYVGFQFGNNFRIENGKPTSIKPPNYTNEAPLRYNWNTPVILSPHNKEIVYYGANKLFRSFDRGATYEAISKDLTKSLKRGDVPYATITSISESPLAFGTLIVGTDDGLVWVTSDGGNNWKNVSKKLPNGLWVSRVIASKHDKDKLYVTLNNYRSDDIQSYVYSSNDFGKTWQSLVNNLPHEAVNVIKEDPNVKEILYLGTDKGLYFSNNFGKRWHSLGNTLPTVPFHDLVIHPRENELVAASHGRSIWVANISPIQQFNEYKNKAIHVFKPAPIKFRTSWNSKPSVWYNVNGNNDTHIQIFSKDKVRAKIDIFDKNDQILYSTHHELVSGINNWHWDHKIDTQKALSAEIFKNKDREKPINKAHLPVSEGIRLGHDTYIQKGKYQLIITHEEMTEKLEITVE